MDTMSIRAVIPIARRLVRERIERSPFERNKAGAEQVVVGGSAKKP
jgi:hypothetical protein